MAMFLSGASRGGPISLVPGLEVACVPRLVAPPKSDLSLQPPSLFCPELPATPVLY